MLTLILLQTLTSGVNTSKIEEFGAKEKPQISENISQNIRHKPSEKT